MVIFHGEEETIFQEVGEEVAEVGGDLELVGGEDRAIGLEAGIDKEFDALFEEASEAFEDAAFEVEVVFFVEDFVHGGEAEWEADHAVRIAGEVIDEAVVFAVIRDEDGATEGAEHIHAVKEIAEIEGAGAQQILHGDFHEDFGFFAVEAFFFQKHFAGAFEEVIGENRQGTEAAAFHEEGFFVEDVGGLDGVAPAAEDGGLGESLRDELEAHDAIVHLNEFRAGELRHIDFDAGGGEVVEKRANESFRAVAEVEGAVDEIDADGAEGILLLDILRIQHADVDNDLAERGAWGGLEADAQPAVGFVVAAETAGGDGICEDKEAFVGTAFGIETFEEQIHFMLQHALEAVAADVAGGRSVNGVAEGHVVGRHGFCNGACGSAHLEKPTGDFLARADFGEGPIDSQVQV